MVQSLGASQKLGVAYIAAYVVWGGIHMSVYSDRWIPVTPLEKMAQTDYDVIIVGSGAGGGAVLWRLCDRWRRNGKRIALLERGDLLLPTHAMNLPTFNHQRLCKFLENPKYKHRVTGDNSDTPIPLEFTQFIALGGRTIHWGMGSPRFHPIDFRSWPIAYRELLPYYRIAERVMCVNQNFTKGSNIQQILIRRLQAIGYPDAMDFPLAIDLKVRRDAHTFHSQPLFSSINFLAHSLNVGAFDLAINTRVVQVLTDKGAVAGVKVFTSDKKTYFINGKTVVLAASTMENPRILLNSDIRGEAIGRYLINHSSVMAVGTLKLKRNHHMRGNLAILVPRTHQRLYQTEIYKHHSYEYFLCHHEESPVVENLKAYVQGYGIVEPRFENCVTLDSGRLDEYGLPKFDIRFSYSESDWRIVQQMVSAIEYQSRGLDLTLCNPPCLKAPGLDYHESGTCRMGNNPYHSVTNGFGEVHGVPNLFVADSSVLPFIGATNPTLTIVALAIRTADYLDDRFRD